MTTLTELSAVTIPRSSRRMWAILGLVLLADALDVIDATVTNIAAPTIAGELHGGESLIKWLGPAYMLAMSVLLVVGGRLGDKFGQRRLFLIGISGFTLASAVAGFSPDPPMLIVARVAQGAFGALLIPQGMAIVTKAFDKDMLARAFGLFAPVLGLSSVVCPVLAGFLISADPHRPQPTGRRPDAPPSAIRTPPVSNRGGRLEGRAGGVGPSGRPGQPAAVWLVAVGAG